MAPRYLALLALVPAVFGFPGAHNALSTRANEAPVQVGVPGIITASQAESVLEAAAKHAVDKKTPSNIAITDPYGHLVAFIRTDGAVLASIEVAQKKARTVSLFNGKIKTGDLLAATSSGGPLYGMGQTNGGLIFFGGGVPLNVGGQFIGAIGVSGGTVAEDIAVANAGVAALK